MKTKFILYILLHTCFLMSCVTSKQYKETEAKQKQCEQDLSATKRLADSLSNLADARQASLDKLNKGWTKLVADTAQAGQNIRQLKKELVALTDEHDQLLEKHRLLESGTAADKKKLAALFQNSQGAMVEQEEMLKRLSAELEKQEKNLKQANKELKEREKRTNELEAIIFRKDSAVKALKQHIADALLGFKNNGLTVEQRNGKVYVSVEEKLLFQSGSWAVDPKGQEALRKLAKALETQEGISIMVEGHTDNVPYNGSNQVKDNWDLSVMRATSITKLLLANSKLKPSQISSAGRSEFLPIEKGNSPEARQKNRRTDIIISPKVDELLKILETN
jgi:chemotaxis protein MotB